MRRLSLAIISLTVMLVGIFSMYSKGNFGKQNTLTQPHGEGFDISCNVCHSTKGWKIDKETYSYNHDSTDMPLIGQHVEVDCKLCHPTLIFFEAKTQCVQCHSDMHESTVGKECVRCHTPNSWLVNNITQIHQQSRFPLVGVHARVDCFECHKSESFQRFDVIGAECYNCHSDNYAATTAPNHSSAGFSTNCDECHNVYSSTWTGTGFNHNVFPLTNAHAIPTCKECHISDAKPSSECVSCHQTDYNATTNPNHISSNFSSDCKICHTTVGWIPAAFDHTNFALTQGHSGRECSECHINGNYSNTSSECVSCHLPDYNTTNNPVHSALNFSTTCNQCHTTALGWKPASYTQHDALSFPIYSGKHNGQWANCVDCHANASNYKEFTCISCHEHNKTDMDDKHSGENGYSYTSAACLDCHPQGNTN